MSIRYGLRSKAVENRRISGVIDWPKLRKQSAQASAHFKEPTMESV